MKQLINVLRRSRDAERPVILHVLTQKGRGYEPAENHPDRYHGVAPFYIESGESKQSSQGVCLAEASGLRLMSSWRKLNTRICAITAAMPGGTGMAAFQKAYPDRFFDVGIAEEHAVTMAAGMAASGMRPYVAIYSTFLERAYDQMLIDVCRNDLAVTFLIDRAGLVGADGATHQGVFDLSYLRSMPNMIVAAPRDGRELKRMLALSTQVSEPMAIRYPKDCEDMGPGIQSHAEPVVGKGELAEHGRGYDFRSWSNGSECNACGDRTNGQGRKRRRCRRAIRKATG